VVGGALIGLGVTRVAMRTIHRIQARGAATVTLTPLPGGIALSVTR